MININTILKKIAHIKAENILLLIYLPYMIINTSRADLNFIASAIITHLLLISAIYYAIYTSRQDFKEYVYNLKPITIKLININAIKKEIFTKAFNNKPTTAIIKYNKTFLNNSIN